MLHALKDKTREQTRLFCDILTEGQPNWSRKDGSFPVHKCPSSTARELEGRRKHPVLPWVKHALTLYACPTKTTFKPRLSDSKPQIQYWKQTPFLQILARLEMRKACISLYGNWILQVFLFLHLVNLLLMLSQGELSGSLLLMSLENTSFLHRFIFHLILELQHEDSHSPSPMPSVTLPVNV